MNSQKWLCKFFCSFHKDIREKSCFCVVKDYADMMSAWLLTTRTLCPCGHWLCRHCVRAVVDYTDTCQRSWWLHRQVSAYLLTTRTRVSLINNYMLTRWANCDDDICVSHKAGCWVPDTTPAPEIMYQYAQGGAKRPKSHKKTICWHMVYYFT